MSYCLGRKAVVTDSRTKKLGAYIGASLPLPPIKVDWTKGVKNYGVMLNDKIGNCTICGVAHAIQVWSNNTGTEVTVPDSDILAMYEAWDGYNPNDPNSDNGGIELNVLKNWKNLGFFGHKLAAFATVSPLNKPLIYLEVFILGCKFQIILCLIFQVIGILQMIALELMAVIVFLLLDMINIHLLLFLGVNYIK